MTDDPPDPRVAISDRQDVPVDAPGLAALAREVLVGEGVPSGELALSFVTEDEMTGLHERYLALSGPTDVLAFPQDDPELLGDVVVCPSYAGREGRDLAEELRLLVAHGTLHVLGYDHEDRGERARMWERQGAYSGVHLDPDEVTA